MTVNDSAPPAPTEARPSRGPRIVGAALSILVGAIYGTIGTVASQNVLRIGEVVLPVGLILSLVGVLALLIGFRLLFEDRLPVLCAAIGMVGMIALFSVASAGGSVLIPQGLLGLVWTVVPVLLATIVVGWPRMPQRPRQAHTADAAPLPANVQHRPEA
ncbi:hypothetical protein [Mycetocola sp. 2940]|uniref:hypothetical protein n=1 Tax=Mycetocola sp. 2940 TaxID=3156452 RepID=UPI003398FE47